MDDYGQEVKEPSQAEQMEQFRTLFKQLLGDKLEKKTPAREKGPQHPLFTDLGEVDRDFSDRVYDYDRPGSDRLRTETRAVVQQYIDLIKRHRDNLTAEDLLNPDNRMSGNIDPVFIPLSRAILGCEVMTPDTWERFRREWCQFDLPPSLYEIFRIQDDRVFLEKFKRAEIYEGDNLKLHALQEMGVLEGLIDERRQRGASLSPDNTATFPS